MRLYREKIPTWQRLALQLSVVVGLGSGLLAMSELIGSSNSADDAVQAAQAQTRHARMLDDVTAYNRELLLLGNDEPLPSGNLPVELIGEPPEHSPSELREQAVKHRNRASLFGALATIGTMSTGLLVPFGRRRRISDDLTEARQHSLELLSPEPPLCDFSNTYFTSEEDEMAAVAAELNTGGTVYAALSYYEHHPEAEIPDSEPSIHPIRSIKNWLARRREIIAQQTSPDAYVYNEFQPPLNAIEPVSLTM